MFLEETGGISSLINSSAGEDTSPDIERENPFREAMIKFTELEREKKAQEEKDKEDEVVRRRRKSSISKGTETNSPPALDTKSTQTNGIVVRSRSAHPNPASSTTSPFKSVLKTQVSCPPIKSDLRPSRSTNKLSYTSTPKPYLAGQINRSFSLGQSLNKMSLAQQPQENNQPQIQQQPPVKQPPHMMTQSFSGALPSQQQQLQQQQPEPVKKTSPVKRRTHQRNPSIGGGLHVLPLTSSSPCQTSIYGAPRQQQQPPLIWHTSPYPNGSNPSLCPPSNNYNANRHLEQQQNRAIVQLQQWQHRGGFYPPPSDRLRLHLDGQSSLV